MEDIWDSIADDNATKLSKKQKELLDEREKDALSGKVSKKSWEEIKQSVSSRKK